MIISDAAEMLASLSVKLPKEKPLETSRRIAWIALGEAGRETIDWLALESRAGTAFSNCLKVNFLPENTEVLNPTLI